MEDICISAIVKTISKLLFVDLLKSRKFYLWFTLITLRDPLFRHLTFLILFKILCNASCEIFADIWP